MEEIWVVNAFSRSIGRGNPAGVCIVDDFPNVEKMQLIAQELGFSNSAFVKKLNKDEFQIRWFTPLSEAPLCGHATVASMHVLVEENLVERNEEVIFESKSGKLFVTFTNNWYNLNFPAYIVEQLLPNKNILNIVKETPIFIGIGENCLFFEFENEETLRRIKPDLEALKLINCRALIATAVGKDCDFLSRYFAPSVGINEDPVCASAHCRLIPYWSQKLQKKEMIAQQASSRGGVIKCKNLGNRVLISGEAVTVFKGKVSIEGLKELKYVT